MQMTRRALLYGAAASSIACGKNGCEKSKGPTDPGGGSKSPEGGKRAPVEIGLSNVASCDASEADRVLSEGFTLVQAEALPFSQGWESFDINRLRGIAGMARGHGATFLLTVVNANGDPQLRLHEDHRPANAFWRDVLRRIAGEIGTDIWLEGVSEPWVGGRGKARERTLQWQEIAVREWPGVKVVNGDDFRGDVLDVHHCSFSRLLSGIRSSPNQLNSTDCTPVLASSLGEARIRQATREAIDRRARLILYDTSNAPGLNLDVLRWMSEELHREPAG